MDPQAVNSGAEPNEPDEQPVTPPPGGVMTTPSCHLFVSKVNFLEFDIFILLEFPLI